MQESRIVHEFNQESRTLRRTGGLGAAYHVLCGADFITNASRTIKQAHRARPRPAFLERMPPAAAEDFSNFVRDAIEWGQLDTVRGEHLERYSEYSVTYSEMEELVQFVRVVMQ